MPDLDELLTLMPPDDSPADARYEVTAADLRAFCAAVRELRRSKDPAWIAHQEAVAECW